MLRTAWKLTFRHANLFGRNAIFQLGRFSLVLFWNGLLVLCGPWYEKYEKTIAHMLQSNICKYPSRFLPLDRNELCANVLHLSKYLIIEISARYGFRSFPCSSVSLEWCSTTLGPEHTSLYVQGLIRRHVRTWISDSHWQLIPIG